jgi:nicotinamide-nucleotide adenylyltransferase
MTFKKLGIVGRFKPLNNFGAPMLGEMCRQAVEVIIGIGSSNRYNLRNPFTAEESEAMIRAFLSPDYDNYEIVQIPDSGNLPQKWREQVREHFGELDHFISGNAYVSDLLKDDYNIVHPSVILPPEKMIIVRSTEVRYRMATDQDWQSLVPDSVAEYLMGNGLVERFKQEFGAETIALVGAGINYSGSESLEDELRHTLED